LASCVTPDSRHGGARGARALRPALPRARRLAADDLLDALRGDKKARERAVRFALPARLGEMFQRADGSWTVDVEQDEILQAVNAGR
jgi:3-dehydroquinate synthetase